MFSIYQTTNFKKVVKKLPKQFKVELDTAVKAIAKKPDIGIEKTGDLSGVRVYKFKLNKQLNLLAYLADYNKKSITLLALGSHENFYRDLKRKIN